MAGPYLQIRGHGGGGGGGSPEPEIRGGGGAGPGATPLDPPLIVFSTVFILRMHGNENFTPPPSLRRRRNLIPVSNVCEAADSTNCRKYVSYTPST